jgi:hypothetical protein
MATPTYTLLDSTTLTSNVNFVFLNGFTQDYRDLILVCNATVTNNAETYRLRFNGVGTNTYYNTIVEGNGNSEASGTSLVDGICPSYNWSDLSTTPALTIFQIFDYSMTDRHKAVLSRTNNPSGASDNVAAMAGSRWANTSAITSITIANSGTTFVTGSSFHLYGIEA